MASTLSTQTTPSTPNTPFTPTTVPSDAPTGTWRHPRIDEIHRRSNAATFTDRNVQAVIWNVVIFLATFFVPSPDNVKSLIPASAQYVNPVTPYSYYALMVLRTLPLLGIAYACKPLLQPSDDLSDIPLTPSQRALLGLQPTSRPSTPGSNYITPPRYARSSTPRNNDDDQSESPQSGRSSTGVGGRGQSGAAYSPSASPLLHKAVGRDAGSRRSQGSPSSSMFGRSLGESGLSFGLNTPSPTNNRGASVGLNNRWLYEKGRSSPGPRSVYS